MKKIKKAIKRCLAYTLSIAMIMPFSATTVFASENNSIQVPIAAGTEQDTVNLLNLRTTTSTDSAVSPDDSQPSTSTGGAVATGTSQPNTSTGGVILPIQTETPAPPVSTETSTPTNTPVPTNTPIPDIPIPTGGAITPSSTPIPNIPTSGAITPTNTPAPVVPTPTPLATGTKITKGNYIYLVNGNRTVTLKGFAKGASLSVVTIKNNITYNNVTYKVTRVGASAFKGQTSIKRVVVRKNVTDIASKAFYQCTNLTKATIRTGVTIIRKQAFMGCKKLKTVNITSSVLSKVKKNSFKNIKNGAVINVMNKAIKLLVNNVAPANVTVNRM